MRVRKIAPIASLSLGSAIYFAVAVFAAWKLGGWILVSGIALLFAAIAGTALLWFLIRRRRLPLSLRFFALMLVILGLATGLRIGIPAWRQWGVIQTVKELGGSVQYHNRGPAWLHAVLGDGRMAPFLEIRSVDLGWTWAYDGTLVQTGKLPSLSYLRLAHTHVTDAGLEHLMWCKLSSLNLNGTRVTDAGLARLAELTSLESLYIENIGVTDAGLSHLKGLKKLRYLFLGKNNSVSNAGVANLQEALPGLKVVR